MTTLKSLITETPFGRIRGNPELEEYYVINVDAKLHGVSGGMEQFRAPQLRLELLGYAMQAVLSGRSPNPDSIETDKGDIYLMWDGGRHYEQKFLGLFVSGVQKITDKTSRNLNVVYSEEALDKRREISRGFMTISHIEKVVAVSRETPKLGKRPNIHFSGTTTGDSIYGVGLPEAKDGWVVNHKVNKAMFG